MIGLFTDFGANGPYLGQMEAVLRSSAANIDVINLVNNAPIADPRLSAFLLAAIHQNFPHDSVILCVVDPGVGGDRLPVVLRADNKWFVGPENGLLNTVAVQTSVTQWYKIVWQPAHLSSSFHGRDLFAPIAALLATGQISDEIEGYSGPELIDWPADLDSIVYVDHYGNLITGRRYAAAFDDRTLKFAGSSRIRQARTFSDVEQGQAFWYCNSSGLVEIAVNKGRGDDVCNLALGETFCFEEC